MTPPHWIRQPRTSALETGGDSLRNTIGRKQIREIGATLIIAVIAFSACGSITPPSSDPLTTLRPSTVASSSSTTASPTPTTIPTVTTVTTRTVEPTVTQAAPRPAPSASQTFWSKSEAAQEYLAAVEPVNAGLNRMNAAELADDLEGVKAACKRQIQLEDSFMRKLSEGNWSPELVPYVEKVIATVASGRSYWKICTGVTSVEEYVGLEFHADPHPGSAQVLRVKLGLPGT